MKRGKPLRRTGNLKRSGELKRSRMKRKLPDTGWRKGKYRATVAELAEIRRRKAGPCRVCGSLMVSMHHLLGGTLRSDEEDNMIPLCGDGTVGCHGIYTSRMRGVSFDGVTRTWAQVASLIRKSLTKRELAYVTERVGLDGLERRYPLAA